MSESAGRYAVFDEIAAGGMATVHIGRLRGAVGFTRTVAIKRLFAHFAKDPEFVAMFLDEARLAARIRHPNVVPTLDVVSEDGELLLVMEYVHGVSLAALLRLDKVPARIAASIAIDMLRGLHAAHEARTNDGAPLNIVHRDVSPQNVLVGADGVARVLDFGVAKAVGRVQITREGQIKGKVAYMAPEHLVGGVVSRRTDVYAAAVVLWETLTGERLFSGDSDFAVIDRVRHLQAAPPSTIASDVPPALDEVTLRGLARDASRRFATAQEMAEAIARAIVAAPPMEVGAWVERTARGELHDRAARIAAIERGETRAASKRPPAAMHREHVARLETDPEGEALTIERPKEAAVAPAPVVPERRRRRSLPALLLALAIAAAAIAIVATHRSPSSPPAPAAADPAPTPNTSTSASATSTTATVAADLAPSSARAPAFPAPRAPALKSATPAPNCNPPYTIDARGFQHPKRECLR